MEFKTYTRKPFSVEAVQITEENIAEIASLLGELKTNADGSYIVIAMNRRIVPNITRAFVGWWVTRVNDGYRCYSPKVFTQQFHVEVETTTNVFQSGGTAMTTYPLGGEPYDVV